MNLFFRIIFKYGLEADQQLRMIREVVVLAPTSIAVLHFSMLGVDADRWRKM